MARFIRELFHGSSYRHHPGYYYDDGVVSYGGGRNMLPDVVLHVPMDSMKCVERVKQALTIRGVHRVRCDVANQTVIVSGNVPPQTLLRRVRWIKRRSEILSVGGPYTGSSYGPDYLPYNPYANERYPMSPPFSNYETFPVNEEYDMEYGSAYGSSYVDPYRRPYPGVGYY